LPAFFRTRLVSGETTALTAKMGIPVDQNSITDTSGRLKEEWRAVFEELPDRFLVGLDINNPDRRLE
jgi:hypothetical protein